MRIALCSTAIALALGLSGTGNCAGLAARDMRLAQPLKSLATGSLTADYAAAIPVMPGAAGSADRRWVSAVGGTCPVADRSVRLFYSDCRSDAGLGAVSVLGVR